MKDWIEVFMPGRLCLFGEHTDWAASYRVKNRAIDKGFALVLGLEQGIFLKAHKSNKFQYTYNNKKITIDNILNEEMEYDTFFDYVIESARVISKKYMIGGAEIICQKMTLPMNKGLASSAAICMAIIRTFNKLYSLNIPIDEEMELAYQAEISIGSKCGRLDQVCAYGPGMRLAIFDGNIMTIKTVHYNCTLNYLLVDLNGNKNTKKILDDLNAEYPYPKDQRAELLYRTLGMTNRKIIDNAITALENGSVEELGNTMLKAQTEFDTYVAPYSNELVAPRLHGLMDNLKEKQYVLGIKGVGSQGDGMAQVFVKNEESMNELAHEIRDNLGFNCHEISVQNITN